MSPELTTYVLGFLKRMGMGADPADFQAISADGSSRKFWRISLPRYGRQMVIMANPPVDPYSTKENLAYLMIARHLRGKGVPVPEIYDHDLTRGWFITEDLGQTNLQDLAASTDHPIPEYEKVLAQLFRLQIKGAQGFDSSWCCQTPHYDRTVMRRYESDYFTKSFLSDYLGLKKEWPELDGPFDHLAEMSSRADNRFFLHRDFQSRNIMFSARGDIGIVDWQGGRLGPLGYDLASLIIDPYTGLSDEHKNELFHSYLHMIRRHNSAWVDPLKKTFVYLAIQRNLQILGAFSFLTRKKKKHRFEVYIPPARKTLQKLLLQADDPMLSPIARLLEEISVVHGPRPLRT